LDLINNKKEKKATNLQQKDTKTVCGNKCHVILAQKEFPSVNVGQLFAEDSGLSSFYVK